MALDLATVPSQLLHEIAASAVPVVAEWGNCDMTTEHLYASQALDRLSSAVKALDEHYQPMVPGREDLSNYGLRTQDDDLGYPVIRDGAIRLVHASEMNPMEKAAVRSWLSFNVSWAAESSASFQGRLEQFDREVGDQVHASIADPGCVEAPASDWRL